MSVVPTIVDYYTVPVNRPVKKQRSHGQGLFITISVAEQNAMPPLFIEALRYTHMSQLLTGIHVPEIIV